MAYALARAFVARGLVGSVRISDPDPERRKLFETEIAETNVCASNAAVADSDVLFLAIKPQTFESVAAEIGESDTLVVSIMAGITLEGLESRLPNARVEVVCHLTTCNSFVVVGNRLSTPDDGWNVLETSGVNRNMHMFYEPYRKFTFHLWDDVR